MRPPREAYVRCVRQFGDVEVITGVELRDQAEWDWMKHWSDTCARVAFQSKHGDWHPHELGLVVEELIVEKWPDRAYFVEVTVGPERDCYTQIFQPWKQPETPPEPLQHGAGSDWDK